MIKNITQILNFLYNGIKSPVTNLSAEDKKELIFQIRRDNLKNLIYSNIGIIFILIVLIISYPIILVDIPKKLLPSLDFVLFTFTITIPILLLFTFLIYHFNFKEKNKTVRYFNILIITNLCTLFCIASIFHYFELKDFNVGNTLMLFLFLIAVIFRFSFVVKISISTLYTIVYFSILYSLGFNFFEIPNVYINVIITIFFYILLATIISRQTEKRFINGILLKKNNEKLFTFNTQLNENRNQIKIQNELLVESNEKLSRFAYMAAHDLKGPLRTTQSLLSILYSKYNETIEEEDKPILEHVMKSSKDLGNLVSNLLSFSSITQKLPQAEIIDIKETIINIQNSLQSDITENNAEIICSADLYNLKANPNLIYQLFLNLIYNGIKFSKHAKNKKIIIDSKEIENNLIKYSVQDFGIGIPKNRQNEIFDIFYKGHSKVEFSGSGIGLSICKKIVEYYQGEIWLESIEGEGTTFYFTIAKNN